MKNQEHNFSEAWEVNSKKNKRNGVLSRIGIDKSKKNTNSTPDLWGASQPSVQWGTPQSSIDTRTSTTWGNIQSSQDSKTSKKGGFLSRFKRGKDKGSSSSKSETWGTSQQSVQWGTPQQPIRYEIKKAEKEKPEPPIRYEIKKAEKEKTEPPIRCEIKKAEKEKPKPPLARIQSSDIKPRLTGTVPPELMEHMSPELLAKLNSYENMSPELREMLDNYEHGEDEPTRRR